MTATEYTQAPYPHLTKLLRGMGEKELIATNTRKGVDWQDRDAVVKAAYRSACVKQQPRVVAYTGKRWQWWPCPWQAEDKDTDHLTTVYHYIVEGRPVFRINPDGGVHKYCADEVLEEFKTTHGRNGRLRKVPYGTGWRYMVEVQARAGLPYRNVSTVGLAGFHTEELARLRMRLHTTPANAKG